MRTEKILSVCIFSIISIIILAPFLSGKYLFLLDIVQRTNQNTYLLYGNTVPIYGGFLPFYMVSSAELSQKIILFIILFLSGYSMYSLAGIITSSRLAKFYAGFLYMLNPYTYIRIIVGHWSILLSYAILPLLLMSFINLLRYDEDKKENKKGDKKEKIKFIFFLSIASINIHTLGIAFMAMAVIFLFWFKEYRDKYRYRDRYRYTNIIRNIVIIGILFALVNSYWILPLITADKTMIDNIGDKDLDIFAPRTGSDSESGSILFTVMSMYGFWREGYIYAKDFIPFWQLFYIFIFLLTFYGFISYYKHEKIGIYVKSFSIIAIIGIILMIGLYVPFSDIYRWLFENTLLKGMRDSQKFTTLLILSYSFLGALGVANLSERIKIGNRKRYIFITLVIIAIMTPFIYSFTFFTGFANQIKPTDYPSDWYEVNQFLNDDKQDFNVLFLPWHQYMRFKWVPGEQKKITNPSPVFFDKMIISGNNIEVGEIYSQSIDPIQSYITFLISKRNSTTNFGNLVAPLNVKYILLTNEVDYKKYLFLFNQSDLELVKKTENFYVFKNRHDVSKIYQVDNIIPIRGWDELLERSNKEDLTKNAYVINRSSRNKTIDIENSDKEIIDYDKKNPAHYKLKEEPSKRYLIFTDSYSKYWKFEGRKPIPVYGMINMFEINSGNNGNSGNSDNSDNSSNGGDNGNNGNKKIIYERFYNIYFLSYIISILSFMALVMRYNIM